MPDLRVIEGGAGLAIPPAPCVRPWRFVRGQKRTGTLFGLSPERVAEIIGFPANCEHDDKREGGYCWSFTVDGVVCSVWSYKGSEQRGSWSTFGPGDALRKLFGNRWMP